MWFKTAILCPMICLCACMFVYSQEHPVKEDSTRIYKDIETYSKRRGFTKFLYNLVFKPVAIITKKPQEKKRYSKRIQKPYSDFEGKTIRNIHIETMDPFGYSIDDTNDTLQNAFIKKANKLHVKSQNFTIRNLLLIRQNQLFDPLLVKESERLVRTRNYVYDVSFSVKATAKNADSVDIFIREIDKWSLFPKFGVSSSNIDINLTDKNFSGLGHESYNSFGWDHAKNDFAYNIKYFIPNIRNSFINSTVFLKNDHLNNTTRSFALDRPFFSPFARWAAGISFTHQNRQDYIHTNDSLLLLQRFKLNTQDYWAGSAIRIFKGNTESKRATNFISAARFLRIRYLERPIEIQDMQDVFSNEDFYMASIGISTRKYVQDKFIFKYGLTEDVPVGRVFSLTGGYQDKNNTGRMYFGARFSSGKYYPWGYLSSYYEYATFMRASHAEQGVFSAGVIYFTGLTELGRWKFRQFVKPQINIGINRFSTDSLTLNNSFGMDGFNSPSLSGTSRLLFTMQTQSYAPWNLIGFHFGPFLIFSLGMLGDAEGGFRNHKVYSQIALGVLIKNENLIISSFQISLAYYPLIPGKGQDIFKLNSYKTTDFDFRDFEIGKPATVAYQ